MGTFGTIFDVGHASGPLIAGLLIGLTGSGADYRLPFAAVAVLLDRSGNSLPNRHKDCTREIIL